MAYIPAILKLVQTIHLKAKRELNHTLVEDSLYALASYLIKTYIILMTAKTIMVVIALGGCERNRETLMTN